MKSQSTGMATAAVASRVFSMPCRRLANRPGGTVLARGGAERGVALDLRRRLAEASLALLVALERLHELALAEVGPEGLRDVDLGVRELPEEEVAHAHLAARPDEEVGIGDALGGEL